MIFGVIVLVIIVAGAVYYLGNQTHTSPAATPTTATTSATTALTTTSAVTTVQKSAVPILTKFSSKSVEVNSTKQANTTVTAPDGVNITVMIPAGTYVLSGNNLLQNYNFTLATFDIANLSGPSGYRNQTPAYGFAFEVNGMIDPAISFVNVSKAPMHLTTITHYPNTWYSWAYVGGTFNSSTGIYTGGNYVAENTWTYNTTAGTMTNTQFYKPIMWIFTIGPAQTTVAAGAANTLTTQTTTTNGYSYP